MATGDFETLKNPAEMSFSDFAEAMKPSGAVNRFPAIGAGLDMYSYSVYMNGPMTKALPEHALEHTFKDVMVIALTDKLGLNPGVARDNLKVAEVVALRSTWMSAVLEASTDIALSPAVISDYEKLTDGLSHPWIASELDKQRLLSKKLSPSMAMAGVLKDVIPRETSVGQVIGQDSDFTFQQTQDGEIVTHENRRLAAMPALGAEITVLYYRGTGQVVNSLDKVKVSAPFIDDASDDLGVMVDDGLGSEQLVLFNSMSSFSKFVRAHGMDQELVAHAIAVREAKPKAALETPKRELVNRPYMDARSGCLAVDYKEKGVAFTALFRNADEMRALAHEFDLGGSALAHAATLERSSTALAPKAEQRSFTDVLHGDLSLLSKEKSQDEVSLDDIVAKLKKMGHADIQTAVNGASYVGRVIESSAMHVAQSIGRGGIVIHDLRSLDKVVSKGDTMTVKVDASRGRVTNIEVGGAGVSR